MLYAQPKKMILTPKFEWEDKLGKQFLFLEKQVKLIEEAQQEVSIDFSTLNFIPPFVSVFLSAYLSEKKNITIIENSNNPYHKSVYFPHSLELSYDLNWKKTLNSYSSKTYLPLIKFKNKKTEFEDKFKDEIIAQCNSIFGLITKIPANYLSGLKYMISEIIDNIEHSKSENSWISYQYYPSKKYIDICIADAGCGLLASYKNYNGNRDFSKIKTDSDAIEAVILGNTTKVGQEKERGFGIYTSRQMIIDGLKGTFLMLSGNSLLRNNDIVETNVFFKGTLVHLRIPTEKFETNFNLYSFVEK
ncbi:MAG: hypothetical protein EAZ53_10570 [Bacteroidetes bacterium]|nr:MAG: hypothetical protein EAZ53_10570 [Bacteroidota bacterium]